MPEKPSKSHPNLSTLNATELARVAAQAGAAQNLAKQLAAINAPIESLTKVIPTLPANNEINKAHQTAADLAKALSRYGALSDLTKSLAFPKVNLNLPDTSRKIQASLPRVLTDSYLRPQHESAGVVSEPKPLPRASLPTSELPNIEVKSPEDLGLLIRKVRERRNQSQQSFADLAGVGRRFVSELENGKATLELGKVLKVMRAAGISIFARSPP